MIFNINAFFLLKLETSSLFSKINRAGNSSLILIKLVLGNKTKESESQPTCRFKLFYPEFYFDLKQITYTYHNNHGRKHFLVNYCSDCCSLTYQNVLRLTVNFFQRSAFL